jgi:predicted PurR-regulated permease PerM
MVVFLTFFLLLAGDKFKRKFVKVVGRTLSDKKLSVQMFDQINRNIQRYMLMLLLTNAALGLATWVTFRIIGLENAGTWALLAAVLHLIPYFGPLLIAIATSMAGLLQFGTLGMASLVGLASLGWAVLIGTVITTWMTGRLAKMNTVAVFVSLLLFSFIWGVWGALLAVPIAVIVKVVSDHVEGLEAFSEFLGD